MSSSHNLSLSTLSVNSDRLQASIEQLAQIGKQPNGEICRLAFSSEDSHARNLIKQWMKEAGMTVRIDAAANIIGFYAGITDKPVLATGSHIDTVPSGGKFDGVLGVLAGIEMVRTLQEHDLRLDHGIEVIVFTDEESTMIGSQAIAGKVLTKSPERYQSKTAKSIQTALQEFGGNWEQIYSAQRSRKDLVAFIELHVEQGAVLEKSKKDIGIVQGVVGMRRYAISITGLANHAGTTPMDNRQDALVAAAQVVLAVRDIALKMPSQPVATVGYLQVLPNAVNIIAGKVDLTVDLRDLSKACLETMLEQLNQSLVAIAENTNVQFSITPLLCVEPTLASTSIQQTISQVCQDLKFSYTQMLSRAGHDSLEIGRITDMGMIFVPSASGISHSEAEYTSPLQCQQGANVLLHTFIKLDRILGGE
jgi:beta-ureidopropionase / N-carbamoyl-L-amino-acid hydrolase